MQLADSRSGGNPAPLADVRPLPLNQAPRENGAAVDLIESGELLIRIRADAEASVLELYGELELANAGALERELRVLEEGIGARTIVLDLSALDFIDTTGLNALVSAERRARSGSWSLGLLRPTGQVWRIIELTGLKEELSFLD
jgi:anti-anti-sigma factor